MTDLIELCGGNHCKTFQERESETLLFSSLNPRLLKNEQYPFPPQETYDNLIKEINLCSKQKVLHIASRLGLSSLYLAQKSGCDITSYEWLPFTPRNKSLYQLINMGTVKYIREESDALGDSHLQKYDAVIHFLGVCRYKNTKAILTKCHSELKPGGVLYFEDFCLPVQITRSEKSATLKEIVVNKLGSPVKTLRTSESMQAKLQKAGFVDIKVVNVTTSWRSYIQARLFHIIRNYPTYRKDIGELRTNMLRQYYQSLNTLFRHGFVGGFRVVCRKTQDISQAPVMHPRTFDTRGYRLRAACVCLRKEESGIEVLLLRRRSSGWGLPGGGVDPGEQSEDAAIREAFEEVGVHGKIAKGLGTYDDHIGKKTTNAYILQVTLVLIDYPEKERIRQWFQLEEAVEKRLVEKGSLAELMLSDSLRCVIESPDIISHI
mmetsp:Transcript_10156/g.13226  ORF Transcript_10156/g.13226 Transcript_10156/m.13226 type:complete len:433 (-) Transcript_10156:922-2220(-)